MKYLITSFKDPYLPQGEYDQPGAVELVGGILNKYNTGWWRKILLISKQPVSRSCPEPSIDYTRLKIRLRETSRLLHTLHSTHYLHYTKQYSAVPKHFCKEWRTVLSSIYLDSTVQCIQVENIRTIHNTWTVLFCTCTLPEQHCTVPEQYCTVPEQYCTVPEKYCTAPEQNCTVHKH